MTAAEWGEEEEDSRYSPRSAGGRAPSFCALIKRGGEEKKLQKKKNEKGKGRQRIIAPPTHVGPGRERAHVGSMKGEEEGRKEGRKNMKERRGYYRFAGSNVPALSVCRGRGFEVERAAVS